MRDIEVPRNTIGELLGTKEAKAAQILNMFLVREDIDGAKHAIYLQLPETALRDPDPRQSMIEYVTRLFGGPTRGLMFANVKSSDNGEVIRVDLEGDALQKFKIMKREVEKAELLRAERNGR